MTEGPSEPAGAALRRRAQGAKADQLQALLTSLDPGVGKWADEFVFGAVWGRPGLDFESRMLVAITSLATQGEGALLRNYAHGALQAGVSARKIHEALVELVVYAGFPTATSMLFEWQQVLATARRQGIVIHEDIGEVARNYDNS
jgi:alkylhydroperoxidase/carboxymuconolactone decarboxylase family protein YurZ